MSILSSLGNLVSSALSKAEQYEANFLNELTTDEQIVAQGVVAFINATETVLDSAKNTVATVPVVGTAGAGAITEFEAILNNLKSLAIAVETGAAPAPGGETNV